MEPGIRHPRGHTLSRRISLWRTTRRPQTPHRPRRARNWPVHRHSLGLANRSSPGQPVKWTEDFAGQIYGVHYKDFVFDPNGQWHDTVVGEGTLDLPAFVAGLEKSGFDGMAVIEYEADVENPVPALTRCVETMRALAG